MANYEKVERIIEQYQKTVGALDTMFSIARPRTKWEVWRFNGVGACADVDKSYSETGLTGEAKETIVFLREKRNLDYGGTSTVSPCPYHRAEHGCVLGDLKSPLCIAHFDADWEWKRKFGVNASALKPEIESILQTILNGDMLNNPARVECFIERVVFITNQIVQYPLLDETPKYLNGK